MLITGFYAGILALIYIILTFRVVMGRTANKVALGDGAHPDLTRRIRVHGNFAEYVPIALILMGILDVHMLAPWLLHVFGIVLVAGRLLHACAITIDNLSLRKLGMLMTLGVIGVEAILAISHYVL